MSSLDSYLVGSLIRKSPMKKVATALALAFAFAAPMAFSTSGVQASPVKSETHMTKTVNGTPTVKQHQGVKATKKRMKHTTRRKHPTTSSKMKK
jgi:hypothetical protein